MTIESIITITIAIVSIIVAPIVYVWKNLIKRIEKIEDRLEHTTTETDVRNLLNDKLEPVKEDLQEIKATIDRIYNHIIENK